MKKSLLPCRLCGSNEPLLDGHVIPGFVFRWLKETSGTGYLRTSDQPNRRVHDGWVRKLLCPRCEGRFSRWERQFAESIFHPLARNESTLDIRYGDWMLPFAVSVSLEMALRLPGWCAAHVILSGCYSVVATTQGAPSFIVSVRAPISTVSLTAKTRRQHANIRHNRHGPSLQSRVGPSLVLATGSNPFGVAIRLSCKSNDNSEWWPLVDSEWPW